MLHFDRRIGSYRPWWNRIEIVLHGWDRDATLADGSVVRHDAATHILRLSIPDQPGPADILIAPR
jgi:hypothetical protein